MGKRLDTTIGPVEYDNLIAAVYPPATTFMVTLDGSQGILKRGTVLAGTVAAATAMTIKNCEPYDASYCTTSCIVANPAPI